MTSDVPMLTVTVVANWFIQGSLKVTIASHFHAICPVVD